VLSVEAVLRRALNVYNDFGGLNLIFKKIGKVAPTILQDGQIKIRILAATWIKSTPQRPFLLRLQTI